MKVFVQEKRGEVIGFFLLKTFCILLVMDNIAYKSLSSLDERCNLVLTTCVSLLYILLNERQRWRGLIRIKFPFTQKLREQLQ